MVAADARTAVTFCLSPGQAHDAPEGRRLLSSLGPTSRPVHLLMDRAYEGNETRQLALDLGFIPVVPPMKTRLEPWEYDREMYKRRNEVERCSAFPVTKESLQKASGPYMHEKDDHPPHLHRDPVTRRRLACWAVRGTPIPELACRHT
jgi:transposase